MMELSREKKEERGIEELVTLVIIPHKTSVGQKSRTLWLKKGT